ncbi:TIGR03943 family protein [Blastococcus sp. TF02A-26]|uniref:TIGR03943 family putative permease subunit n=1 Tax=Blastococcus sp. TF02A-26 TaxID=2250577 RepID=UPI001F2401B7|nr:TIGR03943 family protein [Blastococcus sp. TF02A-26]
MTQHAVLLLLGAYVLQVAITDAHLAYVQGGFRPFLLIAAAVLIAVALLGLLRAWRGRRAADPEAAHAHGAPRVAWLLVAPAAVLALVAPPALGSFTVARQTPPPELPGGVTATPIGPDDPGQEYRTLPLAGYQLRALSGDSSAFEGRRIRLTGFVSPREGGGWYVSRIAISCCAADAIGITVVVDGDRGDLAPDQWVEVIGTWSPPMSHPSGGWPEAVIAPESVRPIDRPADTYVG